jgi:hypothetical protein
VAGYDLYAQGSIPGICVTLTLIITTHLTSYLNGAAGYFLASKDDWSVNLVPRLGMMRVNLPLNLSTTGERNGGKIPSTTHFDKSHDSSVGIATGYGLDLRMIRFRFPAGAGNFYFRSHIQTSSGAHPASYPMGSGGSFPVGKAVGA